MKLISIVVPVCNAQETVGRCIESVLAQTHAELELILVNDGSTDDTASVLDTYARKDERIRVLHTPNRGVSSARNRGLDAARGEFVGFMDADDWIEPDMYERLYALIESFCADISVCGFWEERTGKPGTAASGEQRPAARSLSAKQAYAEALEYGGYRGFLWNKLFRAVFFKREGHHIRLDESVHICEDLLCFCRCVSRAEKIVYDPTKLYHYTVMDGSASNSRFSARKATLLDARRKILELTKQSFPELAKRAESLYITDAIYIYILALRSGADPGNLGDDVRFIRKHVFPYCLRRKNALRNKCIALGLRLSPRAVQALLKRRHRKRRDTRG